MSAFDTQCYTGAQKPLTPWYLSPKPSPLKVCGLPADPLMFQTLIRLATLVRSGITG